MNITSYHSNIREQIFITHLVKELIQKNIYESLCIFIFYFFKFSDKHTFHSLAFFLHHRYSLSVNGNLLDSLGNGVTDSGGYYSRLLQEYDAVILSSSLFREHLSDSVLTSQEPGANQPIHIIMHKDSASSNQIPLVINEVTDKAIIFTNCRTATTPEEAQQGIEIVSMDQINLDVILDYCNHQGLCSVLLDVRGNFSEYEELVKEGIKKKYINKFVTEVLPVWNGCTKNDPLLPLKNLDQGVKVENLRPMASAQSVVIEGYLNFE